MIKERFSLRVFVISLILLVVPIAYITTSQAKASEDTCYASGSYSLVKENYTTAHRPYLDYFATLAPTGDPGDMQGIMRRTAVNVYLKKGETLYLGSSVVDSYFNKDGVVTKSPTGCDILMDTPNGERLTYDVIDHGIGYISTPKNEAAGPYIEGKNEKANTYKAFQYTAEKEGIYTIYYQSKKGTSSANPVPRKGNEQWVQNDTAVAAWNATVIGTDGNVKTGRSFTKMLAMNMGQEQSVYNTKTYIQTTDGYIYRVQLHNAKPWGFIFFANSRGLVNTETNTPASTSYRYTKTNNLLDQGVDFYNPLAANTATDSNYNIFFEEPNKDLEGVLYPKAYAPEKGKNLKFVGTKGDQETGFGQGGYFTFDVEKGNSAEIKLDMSALKNKDGKSRGIVKLTNTVKSGQNKFYWNGEDANGDLVPAGTYDSSQIKVTLTVRSGEYHFPLFDVEMIDGGVTVTRINSIYEKDENGNVKDVTADYESKKSYIYYNNPKGIFDGKDCAIDGVDSTNGAMANKTVALGNDTAIDLWTYVSGDHDAVLLKDDIIIDEKDNTTTISGKVFYDADKDGAFSLRNNDTELANVAVTLTYFDKNENGEWVRKEKKTMTDAIGKYSFANIPVDTDEAHKCEVTLSPSMAYSLTTASASTNGKVTYLDDNNKKVTETDNNFKTNGTETQSFDIGGSDKVYPELSFSNVGYYYDKTTKIVTVKASWDDEENAPASAKMTLQAYYMQDGVRVDLDQTTYDLNAENGWNVEVTDQFGFVTVGDRRYEVLHEIVSEEYTTKDGKTYTVAPTKDGDESACADHPYSTAFKTTDESNVCTYEAHNALKNKSMEITVCDKDDHSKKLSDTTLHLWKAVDVKDIPVGESDKYCKVDGVAYIKVATATTDETGLMSVEKLSAGSYLVTQTDVHYGYQAIKDPMGLTLSAGDTKKEVTVENERSDEYCLFYNWKNYEPAKDVATLPTTDELFDTEEAAKTAGEAQSEDFADVSVRGKNDGKVGTWKFDKWTYDKTDGKDVYVSGEWKFAADEYTLKYEWDGDTPDEGKVTLPKDSTVYNTVDEAKAAVDTTCDSVKIPYVNDKYESGNWVFEGWDEGTLDKENHVITFKGGWKFEQDEADKTTPWHVEYQWEGNAPSTAPAPIDENEYASYSKAAESPSVGVTDSIAGWQNDTECGTWKFNGWDSQTVDAENHKVIRKGTWSYSQKYGVKYQWTGDQIPEGTSVPVDNHAYDTKDQAVDSTTGSSSLKNDYTKGESFEGAFDGEYGTWTFEGWHEPDCQEATKVVVVNGEWSFKADAYKVIYSWNGGAGSEMLPVDENTYNTPDIAQNAKDTKYYEGMMVEDVNEDYEKGAWIFSGWGEGTVDTENKTVSFSGTWTYERDAEDAASKWHNTYALEGDTPEGKVAPIDSNDYDSYKAALAGKDTSSYASFVAWNADMYGVWTFSGWEESVDRDAHRIHHTGSWMFTPQFAVQYVWEGTEVPDGYELPTDDTAYSTEAAASEGIDATIENLSYYEGSEVEGSNHGVDGTWIFAGWKKPVSVSANQVLYVKGQWVFVEGKLYDPEGEDPPQINKEEVLGGTQTTAEDGDENAGSESASAGDKDGKTDKTQSAKASKKAPAEKAEKTNDMRNFVLPVIGILIAAGLVLAVMLRRRKSED